MGYPPTYPNLGEYILKILSTPTNDTKKLNNNKKQKEEEGEEQGQEEEEEEEKRRRGEEEGLNLFRCLFICLYLYFIHI